MNELITCVPLHFVIGKESNEIFRKGMGIFHICYKDEDGRLGSKA